MVIQNQGVGLGVGATKYIPNSATYQRLRHGVRQAYGLGKRICSTVRSYGSKIRDHFKAREFKEYKSFLCRMSDEELTAYVEKVTGRTPKVTAQSTQGHAPMGSGQPITQNNQTPQQTNHQMTWLEEIQLLERFQQVQASYINIISQGMQNLEQALYHVQQMRDADAALQTRGYEAMENSFKQAMKVIADQTTKNLEGILKSYKENEERAVLNIDKTVKNADKTARFYIEKMDQQYKQTMEYIKWQSTETNKILYDVFQMALTGKRKTKNYHQRKSRVTAADLLKNIEELKKMSEDTKKAAEETKTTVEGTVKKIDDLSKKED